MFTNYCIYCLQIQQLTEQQWYDLLHNYTGPMHNYTGPLHNYTGPLPPARHRGTHVSKSIKTAIAQLRTDCKFDSVWVGVAGALLAGVSEAAEAVRLVAVLCLLHGCGLLYVECAVAGILGLAPEKGGAKEAHGNS